MTTDMLPTSTRTSATLPTTDLEIKEISPSPSVAESAPKAPNPFAGKGTRFWLVFLALCTSCFLSAIDLTAVSTAIPDSELVGPPRSALSDR